MRAWYSSLTVRQSASTATQHALVRAACGKSGAPAVMFRAAVRTSFAFRDDGQVAHSSFSNTKAAHHAALERRPAQLTLHTRAAQYVCNLPHA